MAKSILTSFISFISPDIQYPDIILQNSNELKSVLSKSSKLHLLPAALSILNEDLRANVLTTQAELSLVTSLCVEFSAPNTQFINRIIAGEKLSCLLVEVCLTAEMEYLYPTLVKIEKKINLHYIRESINSLLISQKSLDNSQINHVPANVKNMVLRYLQFDKPSILPSPPPTS